MNNYAALLLPVLLLITTACGQSPSSIQGSAETSAGIQIEERAPIAGSLQVTDLEGNAIRGARIMIGMKENVPFPGNILITNTAGLASIPSAWQDSQPITIEANGFVRATYYSRTPQAAATFTLRRSLTQDRLEIKGETQGFGELKRDGWVDFGLVFPTLTRTQINTVQISALISPESDSIKIIGKNIDLPSNMTLPKQTESYVLPITLNKPLYRTYLPHIGSWKLVATHARFPFKQVVDDLQNGKSFFDVINKFEFIEAGFRDAVINKSTQTVNIPVNEVKFAPQIQVTAPNFNAQNTMLALALPEMNGLYYVSDMKRLDAKEKVTLRAPASMTRGLLVSVLKPSDPESGGTTGPASESMSVMVSPANVSQAIEFLGIPASPMVQTQTLVLDPPRPISRVAPAVTYAVLSKIERIQNGQMELEKKAPEWELYADNWAQTLELPELPGTSTKPDTQPGATYRWEVSFGGRDANSSVLTASPAALEKVSHVTRSAMDF